jgi:hypothetical protein
VGDTNADQADERNHHRGYRGLRVAKNPYRPSFLNSKHALREPAKAAAARNRPEAQEILCSSSKANEGKPTTSMGKIRESLCPQPPPRHSHQNQAPDQRRHEANCRGDEETLAVSENSKGQAASAKSALPEKPLSIRQR